MEVNSCSKNAALLQVVARARARLARRRALQRPLLLNRCINSAITIRSVQLSQRDIAQPALGRGGTLEDLSLCSQRRESRFAPPSLNSPREEWSGKAFQTSRLKAAWRSMGVRLGGCRARGGGERGPGSARTVPFGLSSRPLKTPQNSPARPGAILPRICIARPRAWAARPEKREKDQLGRQTERRA
jgi:hypothetical protein